MSTTILRAYPLLANGEPTNNFFVRCRDKIKSIHTCGNCRACLDILTDDDGVPYVFCDEEPLSS
jgi:hypothetical protein